MEAYCISLFSEVLPADALTVTQDMKEAVTDRVLKIFKSQYINNSKYGVNPIKEQRDISRTVQSSGTFNCI
jgi:hypothetical protein